MKYGKCVQTSMLFTFCDANDNEIQKIRKSTNEYVFMNSGGAIPWMSKNKALTAAAINSVEYISFAAVTQEVVGET